MATTPMSHGIQINWFLAYKFINSLFLGLSIGSVFVLYSPLSPSIFSAGGIGLALGTLLIATQYHRLFNVRWLFRISLGVELVILAGIIGVLIHPIDTPLALFIYIGYQFSFAFGSYLVRCETLLINAQANLKRLDIAKQTGYLLGMAGAWLFYELVESVWLISERTEQVTAIHWPLLVIEAGVVASLVRAFPARQRAS
jgi:cyanate permease